MLQSPKSLKGGKFIQGRVYFEFSGFYRVFPERAVCCYAVKWNLTNPLHVQTLQFKKNKTFKISIQFDGMLTFSLFIYLLFIHMYMVFIWIFTVYFWFNVCSKERLSSALVCVGRTPRIESHVWSESVCASTSCTISCADRTVLMLAHVLRPSFGLNAIVSDFISSSRSSSLDLPTMCIQSQSRWISYVADICVRCKIALLPVSASFAR